MAKPLALLTGCTLLTQLCSLAILLLLTRGLSKDQYGAFSFAMTLQSYLLLLGGLGLKVVVIREGTRRPGELDRLAICHLVLTGTVASLLCVLIVAAAAVIPLDGAERTLVGLVAVGNVAACINIQPFFDVHRQQAKSVYILLAAEAAALALIAALSHSARLDLPTVGMTYAGKWAATTALHYGVYHRCVRPLRVAFSIQEVRALLCSSWPVMLSAVVATLPFSAGVFFVRFFQGDASTAVLGLSAQAASAYLVFAALGNRVLQPHIAGPFGLGRKFIKRLALLHGAFLGLLWLGAFSAALIVVEWALDARYREAIVPIGMLLTGAAIHSAGMIGSVYLVVLGEERATLIPSGCASAIYLLGCCLLVPAYSYTGAAVMTVLANLVATVMIVQRVRLRLRGHLARSGPPPGSSAGLDTWGK